MLSNVYLMLQVNLPAECSSHLLCFLFREYPVISKSIVRQRLISNHGQLTPKMEGSGPHGTQGHQHYAYDNNGPIQITAAGAQDLAISPFAPQRDSGLIYHCFKPRGN